MRQRLLTVLGLVIWMLAAFVSTKSANHSRDPYYSRSRKMLIHPGHKYQECGGILNETRGHFHTPNFPNPFPVPISCRWVIQAPPEGYHIVVYFTQLYLRKGVSATEYVAYSKYFSPVQEHYIGEISVDEKSSHLLSAYPVLAIDLEIYDLTNANMRVLDNLMDVYGFNATYEMQQTSGAKSFCTAERCSFNGHCYVDKNYQNFACHCFQNFTGERCQYGPECNPSLGINICKNGGNCSYVGSKRFSCRCPKEFEGSRCEVPKTEPGKVLPYSHDTIKLSVAFQEITLFMMY
ncbi:hypothetical protein CHUAL_005580 [Chamberlinius hualienensis]